MIAAPTIRSNTLLSASAAELLGSVVPDWEFWNLRDSVKQAATARAAGNMERCGMRTFGELQRVTPLQLLAMAAGESGLTLESEFFWEPVVDSAYATVVMVLREALEEVLYKHLLSGLDLQATFREDAIRTSQTSLTDPNHCALFLDAADVLERVEREEEEQYARMKGGIVVLTPDNTLADQAALPPLLDKSIRETLRGIGCDLAVTPLWELSLSTRTLNTCTRAGDRSVDDLARQTPARLLRRRGLGPASYQEIVSTLLTWLAPWLPRLPQESTPSDERQRQAATAHRGLQALRKSRIFELLDQYDVSWRNIPIAETRAESREHSEVSDAGMLVLGDLLEPDQERPARIPPELPRNGGERLETAILRRLVEVLVQHVTSWSALQTHRHYALEALAGVTLESLLFELVTRIGGGSKRYRANAPLPIQRDFDVLFSRFGVWDGATLTLAETGALHGVTRERIRQIEERTMRVVHKYNAITHYIRGLTALLKAAAWMQGGMTSVEDAALSIASRLSFGALNSVRTVAMLAYWDADIEVADGDLLTVSPDSRVRLTRMRQAARELLDQMIPARLSQDELVIRIRGLGDDFSRMKPRTITVALAGATGILCNGGTWFSSRKDTRRAQVIGALRDLGRPAHFTEVAERCRALYHDDQPRLAYNVHAVLGLSPDIFVLVGKGTFALVETGYPPEVCSIAAVLEYVLRESGRPLYHEEIAARATKRYFWKAATLLAELQNNRQFRPFGEGFYGLAEWTFGQARMVESEGGAPARDRHRQTESVVAIYRNAQGNPTAHIPVVTGMLRWGTIHLADERSRQVFPTTGIFEAAGIHGDGTPWYMAVRCACGQHHLSGMCECAGRHISGLSEWFAHISPRFGDVLIVERLDSHIANAMGASTGTTYRITLSDSDDAINI